MAIQKLHWHASDKTGSTVQDHWSMREKIHIHRIGREDKKKKDHYEAYDFHKNRDQNKNMKPNGRSKFRMEHAA